MYGINSVGYGYYPKFVGADIYSPQISGLSSTNLLANRYANPVTNPIPQDKAELSTKQQADKKGLSKGAKWGLGITLVGLGALAYVLTKGRAGSKQVQQLAEHIEFKPAKTIEEARIFAKEHLGIKTYELENLDVANYVNEGLVNLNNTFKGKEMFTEITKEADDFVGLMGCSGKKGNVLNVNEKRVLDLTETKNLKEVFDKFYKVYQKDSYNLSENCKKLIDKFISNPESLTFNEKVNLQYICADFNEGNSNIIALVAEVMDNKQVANYLKSNNLVANLDDFLKLSKEEQINLIGKLPLSSYKFSIYDRGAFTPINHEFGHRMHLKNVGRTRYNEMQVSYKGNEHDLSKGAEHCKKFSEQEPYWGILGRVNQYAQVSECEAVAEIFAGLQNGVKYNSEVLKLYEKYGGPKIA